VEILDYEKATAIVDRSQRFALGICSCRHEKQHAGARGCRTPLEVCSTFGIAADYMIRHKLAREVSQSEMRDNFARSRELGLVFCAGHEGSVRGCLESLRPLGRYTQVGICGREIQFPIDQVFYKQLHLTGSVCYTAQTWSRMMKIYAQGLVRLGDLVSAKLPISEWRTAFDLCMEKQALKVLMFPE
jgi:L-iditol 2-dehydrogenase